MAHDLHALLAGVRSEAGPGAVIAGNTTHGELGGDGTTDGGVAVAALGGDGFTVGSRAALVEEHGLRGAGALVAEALDGIDNQHRVLIMLPDGLAGSPHEIVRGAYSVVGAAVPLVGGFGGDDVQFNRTNQIYNDEVLTGAVVAVALGSDGPIGVGIAHGWHKLEPPMIVTRSQGPRIYELDDRPALDVLLERNSFTGTADDFFRKYKRLQSLGLSRRNGEDIRVIHGGDDEDRTVWGAADVTQGALVWLMHGDRQDLIEGATQSCLDATSRLDGAAPIGALAFDCAGRKAGLLEGGIDEEIEAMRMALRDAPFAGFYTTGEIARTRGASGMHHLTLVTLALA